jgi:hypothetical protein
MRLFFLLIIVVITVAGCGVNGRYRFWDISKFNMVDTALVDGEPIKLFYTSQAPDNNTNKTYYIHIIAVSQKTGDTVNVLTTIDNGFSLANKDEVFNYFNSDNIISKLGEMDNDGLQQFDTNEIKKIKPPKVTKVARDPKHDYIADNKFPTVIGTIGKYTPQ